MAWPHYLTVTCNVRSSVATWSQSFYLIRKSLSLHRPLASSNVYLLLVKARTYSTLRVCDITVGGNKVLQSWHWCCELIPWPTHRYSAQWTQWNKDRYNKQRERGEVFRAWKLYTVDLGVPDKPCWFRCVCWNYKWLHLKLCK